MGEVGVLSEAAAQPATGDREACLALGMDDFIPNPVRLEIVATALARWVGLHTTPEDGHELSVSGAVGVSP